MRDAEKWLEMREKVILQPPARKKVTISRQLKREYTLIDGGVD